MIHGEIKINEVNIGTWTAVRGESIMEGLYRYHCTMTYRDMAGYPMEAEYTVCHRPGEGPIALTIQVLQVGMDELRYTDKEPEVSYG